MSDFFDSLLKRIDDFLFEIIGLILPALLLVLTIILPSVYCEFNGDCIKTGLVNLINFVTNSNSFWIFIIVIACLFVFGNVIKVFSKIYYELGEAIFDNSIFKGIKFIFKKVCKSDKTLKKVPVLSILFVIYKWIKNTLSFSTSNYDSSFESLYINLAKEKLLIENFDYKNNWYYFYKEATNILNNSDTNNLYYKFLSKYNSFRSLEFVFVFSTIYHIIITSLYNLDASVFVALLVINISCVISFHEKFKRYWRLCGNEVITGLDNYFNSKEKSDEK